jgi:nicotinamide mononucleotide transporter
MIDPVEVGANAVNAVSIALAGRRNVHTWWTGLVGCVLFGWVFWGARLYADVCLQGFFFVTGVMGWWRWQESQVRSEVPVSHAQLPRLAVMLAVGIVVTALYAWALQRFTDAAAPVADSMVLAASVLGQLLLVDKRVESWYFWLLTNTIAVPLFYSRGLHLTAVLYAAFWVNALISLVQWHKRARVQMEPST